MNKLSNMKIKFVMQICKKIHPEDCRIQNILPCLLFIYQIYSEFFGK